MRVVVVGGGIAGLAAARAVKLARPTWRVAVLEAANRAAGWVHSHHFGPFVFEHGPRSFRASAEGVDIFRLIESLGLEDEVLFSVGGSSTRFLLHDGQLERLPSSLRDVINSPLFPNRALATAAARQLVPPSTPFPDLSLRELAASHLQSAPAIPHRAPVPPLTRLPRSPDLVPLVDAFVGGIFAGDPAAISVQGVAPGLVPLIQSRGSLVGAMKARGEHAARVRGDPETPRLLRAALAHSVAACNFRHGMGTLTSALAQSASDLGVETFVNAPVEGLGTDPSTGTPRIRCGEAQDGELARSLAEAGWAPQGAAGGPVLEADRVISALPTQRLAAALRGGASDGDAPSPQWPPGLAAILDAQPTASVATVSFGFKSPGLLPPAGFGYLVPSREDRTLLGMIWESNTFPSQHPPEGEEGEEVVVATPPPVHRCSATGAWQASPRAWRGSVEATLRGGEAQGQAAVALKPPSHRDVVRMRAGHVSCPGHLPARLRPRCLDALVQEAPSRVTVMMGGTRCPEVAGWSPEETVERARAALCDHVQVTAPPDAVVAGFHPACIPQHTVGHPQWVQRVRDHAAAHAPWLHLTGNSLDGVGVPATVTSALAQARAVTGDQ